MLAIVEFLLYYDQVLHMLYHALNDMTLYCDNCYNRLSVMGECL